MAENQNRNTNESSDEIDLGQLFKMIGNAFNSVFRGFLRFFLYLKRNAHILLILLIVGLAIGFILTRVSVKKQKLEVIVKPNLESKNYLYGVVEEIQANIKARDTLFFKNLGIDITSLKGFDIFIEPVGDKKDLSEDLEYLELLQKFHNTGFVSDVVRSEILNKTSLHHRIVFYFKSEAASQNASKLMDYINSNAYYSGLIDTYRQNARNRIEQNNEIIEQIDELIIKYSKKLESTENQYTEGKILLDNEQELNITQLFELKNSIIRDTERKKLELLEQQNPISVINFGAPQDVQESFFTKYMVMIPSLLVLMFFTFSLLKFLNEKSKEIADS